MNRNLPILIALTLGGSACTLTHHDGADPAYQDPKNAFHLITGGTSQDERSHWDKVFATPKYIYGRNPSGFLKRSLHQLPKPGRALVFPMSEGQNAVFLAKKGYRVVGIDFSSQALLKAKRLARENNVSVETINADLNLYQFRPRHYDLVVGARLYRPRLVEEIAKTVRPGGTLIYEVALVEPPKHKQPKGKVVRVKRKGYRLASGELKRLFEKNFQVLDYAEMDDGDTRVAKLVAIKR